MCSIHLVELEQYRVSNNIREIKQDVLLRIREKTQKEIFWDEEVLEFLRRGFLELKQRVFAIYPYPPWSEYALTLIQKMEVDFSPEKFFLPSDG